MLSNIKGVIMNDLDAEELAIKLLGLPEHSDYDTIEMAIYKRFEVEFYQFRDIAESLIPFTVTARSAMGNGLYQGFVDTKDNCFIVKQEVK